MTKLPLTQDMLLGLFPTPLEGLDVAVLDQTEEDLDFVYVQRNTEDPRDPRRHWGEYDAWIAAMNNTNPKEQKTIIQPPEEYEKIYLQTSPRKATEKGIISKNDRLVLKVTLSATQPHIVSLDGIRRNLNSDDFKGIGSAFYKNLIATLKETNVDYLTGIPVCEDTEKYWEAQGQVPFYKLPWNDQQAFGHDLHKRILYVHKLK